MMQQRNLGWNVPPPSAFQAPEGNPIDDLVMSNALMRPFYDGPYKSKSGVAPGFEAYRQALNVQRQKDEYLRELQKRYASLGSQQSQPGLAHRGGVRGGSPAHTDLLRFMQQGAPQQQPTGMFNPGMLQQLVPQQQPPIDLASMNPGLSQFQQMPFQLGQRQIPLPTENYLQQLMQMQSMPQYTNSNPSLMQVGEMNPFEGRWQDQFQRGPQQGDIGPQMRPRDLSGLPNYRAEGGWLPRQISNMAFTYPRTPRLPSSGHGYLSPGFAGPFDPRRYRHYA